MKIASITVGLPREVEWQGRRAPLPAQRPVGFYLAVAREGEVEKATRSLSSPRME
jgi:hypothetical protein